MNISINEDLLANSFDEEDVQLTLEEALMCLFVMKGFKPVKTLQSLIDKGVILQLENDLKVYSKYENIIESVMLNSDKTVPKITELNDLVTQLRELFPKERKPDQNGIPKYAYRGNKTDVTQRLQKFFKLYGDYSYDDILECTKRYVESFKYDKTYMKILPYFIMKDGESQLATELENMEDEPTTIDNPNEDWTNTLL